MQNDTKQYNLGVQTPKVMFENLCKVFTSNANVIELSDSVSQVTNREYQIVFKAEHGAEHKTACIVRIGGDNYFELRIPAKAKQSYRMFTRGKYLMHLHLNQELMSKIANVMVYTNKGDMKHSFILEPEDMLEVCKAFKTLDNNYDNHLVRDGEIIDSSKTNRYHCFSF